MANPLTLPWQADHSPPSAAHAELDAICVALQHDCYPPVQLLEESFPLQINWQPTLLDVADSRVPAFDPAAVYRMQDGRYAVALGSISAEEIWNASLRQYPITLVFYVEKDGRYLLDQFVNIFNPMSSDHEQFYPCT